MQLFIRYILYKACIISYIYVLLSVDMYTFSCICNKSIHFYLLEKENRLLAAVTTLMFVKLVL